MELRRNICPGPDHGRFPLLGTATGCFVSMEFDLNPTNRNRTGLSPTQLSSLLPYQMEPVVGYSYGGVSFIKNGTVTDYGSQRASVSYSVGIRRGQAGSDLDSSRGGWASSTTRFALKQDRTDGGSQAKPMPFSWITQAQLGRDADESSNLAKGECMRHAAFVPALQP